jgi:AcrR family transcriptional regulator
VPGENARAALDLFLVQGLDARLNEIARVAGVSIGTHFNRFGSREGLIDAVIPDVAARHHPAATCSWRARAG